MKPHLTERQLIEFQFSLASKAQAEKTAAHLAVCRDCRGRAELLKQKFAALDLLGSEQFVRAELIERVIAESKKPATARPATFPLPAWLGAAAAVIVAAALIVTTVIRQTSPVTERAETRQALREEFAAEKSEAAGPRPVLALQEKASPAETELLADAAVRTKTAKAERITEKPPFAPASAIELVTLPARDNVQLTIYNSADLTLVKETRNLTLKKGWNWLQFAWANTLIDPTSLSLEPLEQADAIDIEQLVFPARLKDMGRWLIHSQLTGRVRFEIKYFTSGLSWRAFYMGTLSGDETKLHMKGYVRLANNSGEDYENAQTRLIVGQVHLLDRIAELAQRQFPYGRPDEQRPAAGAAGIKDDRKILMDMAVGALNRLEEKFDYAPKEIIKEGLSEYFLYTIEGTETVPDKWGKRLPSFDVNDIEVESLYKYDEERWAGQTMGFLSFANDKEHNLGQTPIPNGNVKIYRRADEGGHLSYVGGTDIKYIPVNEEVELNLGPARLVRVEPVLLDFKTDNFRFDTDRNIAGWDEIRTWKIEITNTKNLPVRLEITRGFGTPNWQLELDGDSSVDYEKYDATRARFRLSLPPQTKQAFTYMVTTYYGRRQQPTAQ